MNTFYKYAGSVAIMVVAILGFTTFMITYTTVHNETLGWALLFLGHAIGHFTGKKGANAKSN